MSSVRTCTQVWLLARPSRRAWILLELYSRPSIKWGQRLRNAWWQFRHFGDVEAFDALWLTWSGSRKNAVRSAPAMRGGDAL